MRIAIVLALALTTTACPLGDDDGDPGSYVAVTEIANAYQKSYCTYATRCGLFPDEAACNGAALVAAATNFGFDANVIAAIGAGRVYYNGSNVKRCFDALGARTCDKSDADGRIPLLACFDILRGTVAGGEACTIDEECISGACSGGSTEDTCVMGSCIGDTRPPLEPSNLNEPCATFGLGCVEGLYCESGVCTALKAAGSLCTDNDECAYGTMCINDSLTAMRTCKAGPTVDQPCPDFTCRDDGQVCNSTTTTCKQVGLPPSTCTSSTQCSPYYPCDFTLQQCKKGPSLGQPCSGSNRCFDAGTFCDPVSLMCVGRRGDGSTCNTNSECMSDNCDQSLVDPICTTPTICF